MDYDLIGLKWLVRRLWLFSPDLHDLYTWLLYLPDDRIRRKLDRHTSLDQYFVFVSRPLAKAPRAR